MFLCTAVMNLSPHKKAHNENELIQDWVDTHMAHEWVEHFSGTHTDTHGHTWIHMDTGSGQGRDWAAECVCVSVNKCKCCVCVRMCGECVCLCVIIMDPSTRITAKDLQSVTAVQAKAAASK